MTKAEDPFYNRKPVPDEFIRDVGYTGLSSQDEFANRERKLSVNGVDVRRFSNSKKGGLAPQDDPYYGRKPVNKAEIDSVGDTGLSADEEYLNRERKLSVNGVDLRKFGNSSKGGLTPYDDPYYGRKQVDSALTKGVGETYQTPAEAFEVRERKQSMFELNSDPFQIITGSGHRQSISGGAVAGAAAAATRRRSSAVAPDGTHQATQHHSGYDGDNKLAPIESKPDILPSKSVGNGDTTSAGSTDAASSAAATGTMAATFSGANGHTNYYDAATTGHNHPAHYDDPDSVAPHETR